MTNDEVIDEARRISTELRVLFIDMLKLYSEMDFKLGVDGRAKPQARMHVQVAGLAIAMSLVNDACRSLEVLLGPVP